MLEVPIKLGVVDVMVINPVIGTVSIMVHRDSQGQQPMKDYVSACARLAMLYLEKEGFVDPRQRTQWQINPQLI